jgi:hypothetical protein
MSAVFSHGAHGINESCKAVERSQRGVSPRTPNFMKTLKARKGPELNTAWYAPGSHLVPLYKEIICCLAIEETTKYIFNGYHDYHATQWRSFRNASLDSIRTPVGHFTAQ